jgi:hypothetical protein
MSTVFRRNRKGSDRDITRLNSLGFSLAAIGARLGCHPTSVTLRLKSLKIRPADTRRSFMEGVFTKLPVEYQDSIADMLDDRSSCIQDYVRELIFADISHRRSNQLSVA